MTRSRGDWAIGVPCVGRLACDKSINQVVEILLRMPLISSRLDPKKPGDAVNHLPQRYRLILKKATAEHFDHPIMAKKLIGT